MFLTVYSGSSQSFAGLQAGEVWTAGTGAAINPAMLLGWTHFGPAAGAGATVGQDLLDDLAVPKNGSSGFSAPLEPGSYVLLLQDTGAEVNYRLRLDATYDLKPVGDFNGDFLINKADLTKWRNDAGLTNGSDADGDGDSDGNDFLIWQRNVGRVDFGLTPTPEPTSVALAASAALAILAVHRRRRVR
jgi:MYXO-CTERM domain-containing protein